MEDLDYTLEYKPLNSFGWDDLKASVVEGNQVDIYFFIFKDDI